jgi:hypothetical protein
VLWRCQGEDGVSIEFKVMSCTRKMSIIMKHVLLWLWCSMDQQSWCQAMAQARVWREAAPFLYLSLQEACVYTIGQKPCPRDRQQSDYTSSQCRGRKTNRRVDRGWLDEGGHVTCRCQDEDRIASGRHSPRGCNFNDIFLFIHTNHIHSTLIYTASKSLILLSSYDSVA